MKKLLIVSGIFFLVGLATTEVMGQNPNARQSTPSSSRVQTTTSSSASSAAARQMKKGDSQLNKANSSYQRAQSSTSRTSTTTYTPANRTAAPAARTNNSSSASRTSTSTVKPNTSSSASRTNATVSKPTPTSSSSSSRVSTTTTAKPASNANVSRTNATSTNTSSANKERVAAPSSATAQASSRVPSTTATTSSNDDFSKRGYNANGNAKPQPAPAPHANGPKPIPYVHPNHHNFGHYMTIPPRIRPVYYHGLPYYFYNSLFCRYINGRYIICRPPIGAVIAYTIFNSWRPVIVVHNNINYYYDDGSFYRPAPNRVDYVVVDPPIGARIAELPSNYEEIILDNQVYFKVDNVYYKEVIVSGYIWYEVVFVS